MITHHTQLLNALIEKYRLQSYLEIGVQKPENNFDKIRCSIKCSVDPDPQAKAMFDCTSDEFFSVNTNTFDIIFIDGLHHAGQVKRDFENSLRCLSDNGFIVIHDVLPENEVGTIVPRETKVWWGDVYKFAMQIKQYQGIDFKTFNIDNGCMLIWKDSNRNHDLWVDIGNDWTSYKKHCKYEMKITDEVTI